MRIRTFALQTSLSADECMRLLKEQSDRQCAMFGRPIWPFQGKSSWPYVPVLANFDGDRFELTVDRRRCAYALKGRLLPDPSGQGTWIECDHVCDYGLRIVLLLIAIMYSAFVPYRRHPNILTYSTPEQLHWLIVHILSIGALSSVFLALSALPGVGDGDLLTEFLKATLQAN